MVRNVFPACVRKGKWLASSARTQSQNVPVSPLLAFFHNRYIKARTLRLHCSEILSLTLFNTKFCLTKICNLTSVLCVKLHTDQWIILSKKFSYVSVCVPTQSSLTFYSYLFRLIFIHTFIVFTALYSYYSQGKCCFNYFFHRI